MGRAARQSDELFYGDDLSGIKVEVAKTPIDHLQEAEEKIWLVADDLRKIKRDPLTLLPDENGELLLAEGRPVIIWSGANEDFHIDGDEYITVGIGLHDGEAKIEVGLVASDENSEPAASYRGRSLEEALEVGKIQAISWGNLALFSASAATVSARMQYLVDRLGLGEE